MRAAPMLMGYRVQCRREQVGQTVGFLSTALHHQPLDGMPDPADGLGGVGQIRVSS